MGVLNCHRGLYNNLSSICEAPIGRETIRMIQRQRELEDNLEEMFFQQSMVYEAVKKLTDMRNPKYNISFEWDLGHNGQRWAYKDEIGAKGKRPIFHLTGKITLKIKDNSKLSRCLAPLGPCLGNKPSCCVPVCSEMCDLCDHSCCKAIDRNAGWGTCCGIGCLDSTFDSDKECGDLCRRCPGDCCHCCPKCLVNSKLCC